MTTPSERQEALDDILAERVLVLDGAMGTMLQQRNLTAADFGGPALEGCNESLNRTRPDVVREIHPRLSGGRIGCHRNQHLQLRPHFSRRLRLVERRV